MTSKSKKQAAQQAWVLASVRGFWGGDGYGDVSLPRFEARSGVFVIPADRAFEMRHVWEGFDRSKARYLSQ